MSKEQSPPAREVLPFKPGKRQSTVRKLNIDFAGTALDEALYRQEQEEAVGSHNLDTQPPTVEVQPPTVDSQPEIVEESKAWTPSLPYSQEGGLPASHTPTAGKASEIEKHYESRQGRERLQARIPVSKVSELNTLDFLLRQMSRKKKGYKEQLIELGVDFVLANRQMVMDWIVGGQPPSLTVSQPPSLTVSQEDMSPPINKLIGNKVLTNNDLLLLYVEKLGQWGARLRESDEPIVREIVARTSKEIVQAGILVTAARVMMMVINKQPVPKINGFRYCENVIDEMAELGGSCTDYANFSFQQAQKWFNRSS